MKHKFDDLFHLRLRAIQRLQTVRVRLLSLVGLVLLFTLLLISFAVLAFVQRTEADAWRGRQSEAARNAAYRVAAFIQRADDTLHILGELGRDEIDANGSTINALLIQNPAFQEIVYLDKRGAVIGGATQDRLVLANLFTIPQSQWFLQAQQGHRYYGSVQFSSQDKPYLIMAAPALAGEVVAARLAMHVFWDVVADIHFGETGRVYVVNQDGQVLAHTDRTVALANTNIVDSPMLIAALQAPNHDWFGAYSDLNGVSVVGVTTAVPGADWLVITEISATEAFATSRRAFLLLGGGMLLFGIFAMWTSVRLLEGLILQPLETMRDSALRFGYGDLHHRIGLRREDEIGQAAAAFDNMANELQSLYNNLEQKIAERTRDLNQQKIELERSNTELAQFAYVASHDLQEPLRMVTSYLQLLERRYKEQLDNDAHEFIGYAVDGATRMQQLIKDLLTYSRVGTRGQPFSVVNCNVIFDQVVKNLQIAIEESCALITHEPLPTIMADATQMGQLLQNLMTNALKFRNTRLPEIHLGVKQDPIHGEWLFSIRDNGIGIAPEYTERIFLIFQRLHTRTEYPGTGIGLAICKKIVERHGGRIWVDSKLGAGATFYFTIRERS